MATASNATMLLQISSTGDAHSLTNTFVKPYLGFVLMHTLKAGGNSLEGLLNKAGWDQYDPLRKNRSFYLQQLGYVHLEDEANTDWYNTFSEQEQSWGGPSFASFGHAMFFRIGMVREPCDYHVSVWAFSGKGAHGNLTGNCAGREAIDNFHIFLNKSTTPSFGWLSYRLASMIRTSGLPTIFQCPEHLNKEERLRVERAIVEFNASEAADCWVRTENMASDLKSCLQLYAKRRGGTNMNLDMLPDSAPHANKGSHHKCSSYFTQAEADSLWQREGGIAKQMGYTGCCQGLR
jgi:hypothetical protein